MESEHRFLTIREAADFVRMTPGHLAQLRFRGVGPRYLKPTPRTVLYRLRDLEQWIEASERSGTA